jgi:nucleoid-associated protein YgaU
MASQADLSAALQRAGVTLYGLQVSGGSVTGTAASEEDRSKAYGAIAGVDNALSLNISVDPAFQTQASNSAAAGSQSYTVRAGDSLGKIAKQFYGDAGQWKKIHEANRDAVPNPDLIHPGQQLTIPG